MWAREMWGLVLNLFGGFIPRISSRRGLGFGSLKGIISRIPSRGGLGLSHGSMSGMITSWAALIHLSENGSLEAIGRFLD